MRHRQQWILTAAITGFCGIFSLWSPYFWNWDNLRNVLDQSTLNITVGLGMALIIASGSIDLSVGAAAALIGVALAPALKAGLPLWSCLAFALGLGIGIGYWNSLIVVRLRVNPFMGTLTSMTLLSGLALILTGGTPVYGFPKNFAFIGRGRLASLPLSVWICGILFLTIWAAFCKTRLGCRTLALSSNPEALRRCGVNVDAWRTGLFCLCGGCAAIASVLMTSRLNSAEPLAGTMMEMDAIATAVLGGTAIQGGRTSLPGVVLAGLLIALVKNGLTMLNVSSYYQSFSVGLILLCAITLSEERQRR